MGEDPTESSGATAPLDPTRPLPAGDTPPTVPERGEASHLTFSSGMLVAGRFRVERFIARGGMGEVYAVRDELLGERVALKTLRSESGADTRELERLRREVLLARKVTHGNVCRIFDVGQHVPDEGPSVTFLTMELLEGETLGERLRVRGRMEDGVTRAIGIQLAEALAAAHDAGVLHLDFKPDNVFLVPTKDGGTRCVVTDFGLARALGHGPSGSGGIAGTPAYMSPEQVRGDELGTTSDVYALGVVLYEMVTGRLPFHADSPIATAMMRLSKSVRPPREIVPDMDPALEPVILTCLHGDHPRRFSNARDVSRALGGEGAHPRRRIGVAVLAAIAAVGLAGVLAWRSILTTPQKLPTPAPAPVVAVLGFRNLSGDPETAWLSTALTEMISSEVGTAAGIRTIPGERIQQMRRDLALPDAEAYSTETLARIHAYAGADVLVLGSFLVVPEGPSPQVRLDLRIQSATGGELLKSIVDRGPMEEILDLVSRAGDGARAALGHGETRAAPALRPSFPESPEALRLYAEGLLAGQSWDYVTARAKLEGAVEKAPSFALARASLAYVLDVTGYDEAARREADRAHQDGVGLSEPDRRHIEDLRLMIHGHWKDAAERLARRVAAAPDDDETRLLLAKVQISANQADAALRTLDELRRRSPSMAADARVAFFESRAHTALYQDSAAIAAAERAEALAQRRGERLLLAEMLQNRGAALLETSRMDEAMTVLQEAERLYEETGFLSGALACRIAQAQALNYLEGNWRSRALYEELLCAYREHGFREHELVAASNLAFGFFYGGDPESACALFLSAAWIGAELRDVDGGALAVRGLGQSHSLAGRIEEARSCMELSRRMCAEAGLTLQEANNLLYMSRRALDQGDMERALSEATESIDLLGSSGDAFARSASNALAAVLLEQGMAEEALRLTAATPWEPSEPLRLGMAFLQRGEAMLSLGRVAEAEANITASSSLQEQACVRTRKATADLGLAEASLWSGSFHNARVLADATARFLATDNAQREPAARRTLAEALYELGDLDSAERHARHAAAVHRQRRTVREEALSQAVLAAVLLGLGARGEATEAAARSDVLTRGKGLVSTRLRTVPSIARVEAASGRAAVAVRKLQDAITTATTHGLKLAELDARLALLEITGADPSLLATLAAEAEALGIGRIAQRARARASAGQAPPASASDLLRSTSAMPAADATFKDRSSR